MLSRSQVAQPPPAVGSLFVPTLRRGPAPCRIAGLQRQPGSASQDSGLAGALGSLIALPGRPGMQQQQPERVLLPELELLVPQQRVVPAAAAPVAPPAAAVKPRLTLSWAGSGIFFWWQLGAVQYLAQQFRLGGVPMVGASGGGLAAVLATCEVEPEAVMDSAYRLASEHRIWERPLGLMGTWGGIIEHWLDELLPANAAERCRGQVGIVVTQLPSCRQLAISDFADKEDLINVAMASAHVPIFLDWKVRALLSLLLLPFQPSRLQHV